VDHDLIAKEKNPSKGLGRPRFTYSVPRKVTRQVSSSLSDLFTEAVFPSFSRLKHLCRFEKGGYCKKIKKKRKAQNCPQILNKGKNHFTPFLNQAYAHYKPIHLGSKVTVYDPHCNETFGAKKADSIYEVVKDADCLVIITDQTEFKNLNLQEIKALMNQKTTYNRWKKNSKSYQS
jgi:hypothetical protein